MNRFITVENHRIETTWIGPPPDSSTTLVFLHEGLGSLSMWKQFPQQLADALNCSALIYSRSGYGASSVCDLPRPLNFMHTEAVDILPAVLKELGVTRFILVGHSDGASIALIYAGHKPAPGLLGVIVEAPHLFVEEMGLRSIELAREAYLHGDLRQRLTPYHDTDVDAAFRGWNDAWLDPEFVHWEITEYVKNVNVPILSLQGEEDPYGSREQVDRIKKLCPDNAQLIMLKDCAHSPHREQNSATLKAMSRFAITLL